MKRKLIMSIFCAGLLATSANAVDTNTYSNNYSTILQVERAKQIDNLLDRVNNLMNYTNLYVLQTGDINPTLTKVKNYFGLPDSAIYNFTNGTLTISCDDTNYNCTVGYLFNSKPDNSLLTMLKNSSELNPLSSVSSNGLTVTMPYEANLISFVDEVKKLPATSVVSATAPGDITKIWYQPDGKGSLTGYKYNTSKKEWEVLGVFDKDGIVVDKVSDLSQYNNVAGVGAKAYVKNGDNLDAYVYDGNSWCKLEDEAANNAISQANNAMNTANYAVEKANNAISQANNAISQANNGGGNDGVDLSTVFSSVLTPQKLVQITKQYGDKIPDNQTVQVVGTDLANAYSSYSLYNVKNIFGMVNVSGEPHGTDGDTSCGGTAKKLVMHSLNTVLFFKYDKRNKRWIQYGNDLVCGTEESYNNGNFPYWILNEQYDNCHAVIDVYQRYDYGYAKDNHIIGFFVTQNGIYPESKIFIDYGRNNYYYFAGDAGH